MVGGDALQIYGISSRDVQLLLWAVGEARGQDRRQVGKISPRLGDLVPADRSDFFTEWQPAAR